MCKEALDSNIRKTYFLLIQFLAVEVLQKRFFLDRGSFRDVRKLLSVEAETLFAFF